MAREARRISFDLVAPIAVWRVGGNSDRAAQFVENLQHDLATSPLLVDVGFAASPAVADLAERPGDDPIADHTDGMLRQVKIEHDAAGKLFVADQQCLGQSLTAAYSDT